VPSAIVLLTSDPASSRTLMDSNALARTANTASWHHRRSRPEVVREAVRRVLCRRLAELVVLDAVEVFHSFHKERVERRDRK
jgi:Ribonuclease G/E